MATNGVEGAGSGEDTAAMNGENEGPGEAEPLDLGEVSRADESIAAEERIRAKTARFLTFLLVWMFGISFALHYVATAVFRQWGDEKVVEALGEAFQVWLPVISGFVGSAVTYYLTREK
jgi:hypothetical protein